MQFTEIDDIPAPPAIPAGRFVDLPGRGTTWAYDTGPPVHDPDAPTLVLLHGWTATAALNWIHVFEPLSTHYRVVALDHRGHGRGLRTWRRFRLEDCADDAAALCDALGIARFVPVGYSMGGPIAQLTWRRHRHRVEGMVLCATSRNFRGRAVERALFVALGGMALAARVTPGAWRDAVRERVFAGRFDSDDLGRWASSEVARNDPRVIAEAGRAIGSYSSHEWIGGVDVPTAVVVTELDPVVPSTRQRKLAAAIPGASIHPVAGDHSVCAMDPTVFLPGFEAAVADVVSRATWRSRRAG